MTFSLDHPLFRDPPGALDRYLALLDEDTALRQAEYDHLDRHGDPKRRRLRIACNECTTPWCCNQRVDLDFVEALALYRWAAEHVPAQLAVALRRGEELHARPPLDDVEHFRRRVACPFLLKGGRCAVYAARPHACRSHYMAGAPIKCRDQLAPADTFQMSPDHGLLAELAALAEDVRFHNLVEGARPTELAQTLHFIHRLLNAPPWRAPRVLDWDLVEPASAQAERDPGQRRTRNS